MGDIIGHKDRQIWSPSHVLQDPLFDHSNKHQFQNHVNHQHLHQPQHQHHHNSSGGFRRPGAPPLKETFPVNYNTRQKHQSNWQRCKGEDRMQAFFLVSPGRTSSGTGVFLPTTAFHPPTKKPACSPVLLPTRVVQALNLNVHNNGIHISPRPEIREDDSKKKKSEMLVTPVETEVETPIDSLEKLLPEEWIY